MHLICVDRINVYDFIWMFSTFVRYYHFVTNSLAYQSGNPGRCIAPHNILKLFGATWKNYKYGERLLNHDSWTTFHVTVVEFLNIISNPNCYSFCKFCLKQETESSRRGWPWESLTMRFKNCWPSIESVYLRWNWRFWILSFGVHKTCFPFLLRNLKLSFYDIEVRLYFQNKQEVKSCDLIIKKICWRFS